MTSRLQRPTRFAARVARRFFEDGCLSLAGSLTFTTLLAIVPLLTIALTLITAFPVFERLTGGLEEYFTRNLLPPEVARTVAGYIQQFTASAAQLTAAGIALLAVTAVLMMATIERAFDGIWRVTRPRALGARMAIYWAVLTLGPLLIGAGLTMTSYLVGASAGFSREIPGLEDFLLEAVPVVLTACAFTFAYFVVPNRPVDLAHAAVAGFAAALAFELMKRGFALYVARFPTYALVYGAFAAIPIFLLWIYLSWVITLLGAVIAALLPDYGADVPGRDSPGTAFRAVLEVLGVLVRAQAHGRTPATRAVVSEAGVGRDAGFRALDELAAAGWAARVIGDRWALACDPDTVTVAAVYRRIVFDPATAGYRAPAPGVAAVLDRAAQGAAGALDVPIRALAGVAAEALSSPR